MSANILMGLVSPISGCLSPPAERGFSYITNCKKIIHSAQTKADELKKRKEELQDQVASLRINGEEIRVEVTQWIDEVEKAIEAAEGLDSGQWWNLKRKYSSGKKAKAAIEELSKLEKGTFDIISIRVPRPIEIESVAATGGFEEFAATRLAMDQVMAALKDDKATVIGVYGTAGVGKTALVEHVSKQAHQHGLFEHAIKAVFTQHPDTWKIQGQLADMLGLKLQEQTELGRAGRLNERILRGNKTLIILDDVWNVHAEVLPLEYLSSIGIPSHEDLQKCHSKVILTTALVNVCSDMKTDAKIHLNVLSDEDAWRLFLKEAGKSFEETDFCNLARKVVSQCRGLPVALVAVARELRDKDSDELKEAARQLKRPWPWIISDPIWVILFLVLLIPLYFIFS